MKIWWEGVLTWKGGAPQTLDPGQRSHWVWTLPKLLASCHVLRLRSYAKGKSDFLDTSSGSMCRYESFGERNLRLALRWLSGKESACQQRRLKRCRFNPWVEKMPWRRKWQPAPVFLPGKSHGQRSLEGYSLWGWKSRTRLNQLDHHQHTCPPKPSTF